MAKRLTWKERLLPFANDVEKMYVAWNRKLDRMTTGDLRKLLSATKRPTDTNCWWATAVASHDVRVEIKCVLRRRRSMALSAAARTREAVKRSRKGTVPQ